MRNAYPREVEIYRSRNGREPFTEWLNAIRDQKTQRRIRTRIAALKLGNFGDSKSVGAGSLSCVSTLAVVIEFILVK